MLLVLSLCLAVPAAAADAPAAEKPAKPSRVRRQPKPVVNSPTLKDGLPQGVPTVDPYRPEAEVFRHAVAPKGGPSMGPGAVPAGTASKLERYPDPPPRPEGVEGPRMDGATPRPPATKKAQGAGAGKPAASH